MRQINAAPNGPRNGKEWRRNGRAASSRNLECGGHAAALSSGRNLQCGGHAAALKVVNDLHAIGLHPTHSFVKRTRGVLFEPRSGTPTGVGSASNKVWAHRM